MSSGINCKLVQQVQFWGGKINIFASDLYVNFVMFHTHRRSAYTY